MTEPRSADLVFEVGRDASDQSYVFDLADAPHLLIAGTTGSGKSVMIHNIILSLLDTDARLILMDLKMVELGGYNGLPQLLTPVIFETPQAQAALKWAVHEMDRRYQLLLDAKVRNITTYNETADEPLVPIVIIIDELADLMLDDDTMEKPIVRIAQKARAAGIHVVLATQRPSVDVVTGLIKANIPTRMAFRTASPIDSRVILDERGAEKLRGRGDLLFKPATQPEPVRLQGAFVSDKDVAEAIERYQVDNT